MNTIQTAINMIQIHHENGLWVNSSNLSDSRLIFSKLESASFVDCSRAWKGKEKAETNQIEWDGKFLSRFLFFVGLERRGGEGGMIEWEQK